MSKIYAANDKLCREMENVEIRLRSFYEKTNTKAISVPIDLIDVAENTDSTTTNMTDSVLVSDDMADVIASIDSSLTLLNNSSSSFETVDEIGYVSDSVSLVEEYSDSANYTNDELYVTVDEWTPNSQRLASAHEHTMSWVYVASADNDFCEQRLKNYVLWNFGIDNLKMDLLSRNKDATYTSFKIAVPSDSLPQFIDHKKWPKSYYVRHFDESKRANFHQGTAYKGRRKMNFVHNPVKLRV